MNYDALLLVSFGGPEGVDEVLPFLERVLRGRRVSRERMMEVAEHYYLFGGVSPINEQNRKLIDGLEKELKTRDLNLPVYWGNRNWHPLLPDTVRQMAGDGIKKALAFVTSAYSSYSSCRQYLDNIEASLLEVGSCSLEIDKIRPFFHHPGFIETMSARVRSALNQLSEERQAMAHLVYTAHSIPSVMASGCLYERQLREASRLISKSVGSSNWSLTFQSRSGPPTQQWLEPDVCDYIRSIHTERRVNDVVVVPVGFISDHMEVVYDLDVELQECCDELGMHMVRAKTPGTHPSFVRMIADLVEERLSASVVRPTVGGLDPCPDQCPLDCCPPGT